MAEKLPPVPHQQQLVDLRLGKPSQIFSDWLQKAFLRMGGHIARSNDQLGIEIDALTPHVVPTGGMVDFGGTSAPTGWLLCDGSAVSRITYAALFAVIGTAFGVGDGSTTFNLPASGKFNVSKGAIPFSTLGGTGGAESVSLPNHVHSTNLTTSAPTGTTPAAAGATSVATGAHTHAVTGNTDNPTTTPSIATLPPYQVVNRIIKT